MLQTCLIGPPPIDPETSTMIIRLTFFLSISVSSSLAGTLPLICIKYSTVLAGAVASALPDWLSMGLELSEASLAVFCQVWSLEHF